ncbi:MULTISPECIES: hypothetical protein [unclassified Rhodanobacter]|uniref:hypothetical protein n=1 Tax=unclassified Rhodanobacter TaxID=2621553 RepID=UPI001BDF6283|nr:MULTISPECIES: hypothetical protein [unclassified Rhodanobacter]MBT2142668.1 hypothetical protein [Rhodanobacter sp. LX-99]MBT2148259.1 hypothetical protein [Rhodanobacter sp. LX-100]
MPNLTPVSSFDDVPELETSTLALGGPGGPMNLPAQALLNRTQWLKDNAAASTAGPYAAGSGTANAITAAFTPPITSMADGLKLRILAAATNTGAATFAPDALTAQPIVGGAYAALQGGEILANGEVELTWNATLGAWVITAQAGGSPQVPDAAKSKQAASKGQVDQVSANLASSAAGKGSELVAYDATRNVKQKFDGLDAEAHTWNNPTTRNLFGDVTQNFVSIAQKDDMGSPFIYTRKTVTPTTSQYAGAHYDYIKRVGGAAWACNQATYWVTANMTTGFDVCSVNTATAQQINGGTLLAQWNLAMSPCIADPGASFAGKVYVAEFNHGNRWAEFGLSRNINSGSWVGGLLIVPDVLLGPDGYTSADGNFNSTFGLIFGPSGSAKRTWTLIHADDGAVPAGGLHMCMRGGTVGAGLRPQALLEARDEWVNIIDLSPATDITGKAILLAANHTIAIGDWQVGYGSAIPTTGAWYKGSVVYNTNAGAAGNPIGWVNVGQGTPGVWRELGWHMSTGSKTYDPPSIASMGTTTTTVTCTGAAMGQIASAGFSLSLAGLMMSAYVSAADTVTVVLFNPTGATVDIASGTLKVRAAAV